MTDEATDAASVTAENDADDAEVTDEADVAAPGR